MSKIELYEESRTVYEVIEEAMNLGYVWIGGEWWNGMEWDGMAPHSIVWFCKKGMEWNGV